MEKYIKGYWPFMFKESKNWIIFVFSLIFYFGATIQEFIFQGEISESQLALFFVFLTLFYNWYCWDEQKKGKTS